MKRVLKISCDNWNNESRDKRELSSCRELGMETLVMAKGKPEDSFRKTEVDGFPVYLFSTRPLGTARWLNPLNRLLSLFVWGWKARKFKADIITGHDLPGLFIGYLSNIGNLHKAKLVYDSHEFEIGRAVQRNRIQLWGIMHVERFLIKRCNFSIMVNDSIADEVQRIYHLQDRPVVAWNTPFYWELDLAAADRVRAKFLKELGLPEGTFLVMYHGAIMRERGIENLLRAVSQVEGIAGVILGNAADSDYMGSLHALCEELGLEERILFHPAVPVDVLRNYVGAVNISVFVGIGNSKSYYLSLPNKFFEAIQSLTPQITSNFPEMGKIMQQYEIGISVNPENVTEIADAIRRLKDDQIFYAACKKNLKYVKEKFCWEKEQESLKEAYRRLL